MFVSLRRVPDKAIRSIHTRDDVYIRQNDDDYVGSRPTLCPSICSGAESCKPLESALNPLQPSPLSLPLPTRSRSQTELSISHLFLNKGIRNCLCAGFSNKNPGVAAVPALPSCVPTLEARPPHWAALGRVGEVPEGPHLTSMLVMDRPPWRPVMGGPQVGTLAWGLPCQLAW